MWNNKNWNRDEAEVHRLKMHMDFKRIPLDQRPLNPEWLASFNFLMDAEYDLRHYAHDENYKPYALFKLCRDGKMPDSHKKLIYERHRKYYLNYVYGQPGIDMTNGFAFTRHFMYFAPFLNEDDQFEIYKEIVQNPKGRPFFREYVFKHNVINMNEEQLLGRLVADRLIGIM